LLYRRHRQSMSRADVVTLMTLMTVCHAWRRLVEKLLSQLKALVIKGPAVYSCLSVCLSSTNARPTQK